MATFTLVINDPRLLAGLEAARLAYNAALPPVITIDPITKVTTTTPDPGMVDAAAYVNFVGYSACLSYCSHFNIP